VLRDGEVFLHDDNSLNGTWRNDERVGDGVALEDGDIIRVGDTTLLYAS
jgi:pSer/pThr/pTyr-binding forkhead associated (FHA) protein